MNEENINDIVQKFTCFGSLAFCCDLVKPCAARDRAMKEIGLKPGEFSKLKAEFDKSLSRIITERKV